MAKSKQLSVFKKSKIVVLNEQGQSNRDIARLNKCNESTVRRFLKRYKETGKIERKSGSGRKRSTTKREDNFLKRSSLKNRFATAPQLKRELEKATATIISTTTVQRRLNEMGILAYRTARKPLLTKQMRANRRLWAKERKNWTLEDWNRIIFSDESKFNLFGSGGKSTVRRRKNERLYDECVTPRPKRSEGVMVWGAITYYGVGRLIIIDGTINASKYRDIIVDGVIPTIEDLSEVEPEIIFQDDCAPCHRAKSVQNFKESLGIRSLPWPGNRPDMNPIEHVWNYMGRKINERKPENLQQLKNTIEKIWYEDITPEYLKKLYDSMPNRLNSVLRARGGYTRY